MIAALVIVFREILEAGLIVGIVMAATDGLRGRGLRVGAGIAAGVLGAGLVAIFADVLAGLVEGAGQDLFNAGVLLLAVAMLTWHNVWMASHGREMARDIRQVGTEIAAGERPLAALAVVVGVAVMREGSEIVLFLYGSVVTEGIGPVLLGGVAGLALGGLAGALVYRGLLAIPTRHLFAVTTWMIALLAAGMAAEAVRFLAQADLLTLLGEALWDTSFVLSEASLAGKVLHTLLGYTAQPSGMQLLAYLATLAVTFALMRWVAHAGRQAASPRFEARKPVR